jgi:hypothetical protein
MTKKRQNARMKTARKKSQQAPATGKVDIGTAIQRALRDVRQMTSAQRRKSLIEAGILTKNGGLAASYR